MVSYFTLLFLISYHISSGIIIQRQSISQYNSSKPVSKQDSSNSNSPKAGVVLNHLVNVVSVEKANGQEQIQYFEQPASHASAKNTIEHHRVNIKAKGKNRKNSLKKNKYTKPHLRSAKAQDTVPGYQAPTPAPAPNSPENPPPADPNQPANPPEEPSAPADNPTEVQPDQPSQPDQPTQPDQPNPADQPSQPDQPNPADQPDQPNPADQPEQPNPADQPPVVTPPTPAPQQNLSEPTTAPTTLPPTTVTITHLPTTVAPVTPAAQPQQPVPNQPPPAVPGAPNQPNAPPPPPGSNPNQAPPLPSGNPSQPQPPPNPINPQFNPGQLPPGQQQPVPGAAGQALPQQPFGKGGNPPQSNLPQGPTTTVIESCPAEVESVGCYYFKAQARQAFSTLIETKTPQETLEQLFCKCGTGAQKYGWTTFVISDGKCYSGPNESAYNTEGVSQQCFNEAGSICTDTDVYCAGDSTSANVYSIITQSHRSIVTLKGKRH